MKVHMETAWRIPHSDPTNFYLPYFALWKTPGKASVIVLHVRIDISLPLTSKMPIEARVGDHALITAEIGPHTSHSPLSPQAVGGRAGDSGVRLPKGLVTGTATRIPQRHSRLGLVHVIPCLARFP
jgi:hypothetical protein